MSYFTKLMLLAFISVCLILPVARANDGVVYVVLFMHNEDSALGDFSDPGAQVRYLHNREMLVEMGRLLHNNNVPFDWESDWKFLQGVLKYETPELEATTNNKNLVRYLSEDLGITVDPHSHEHYGYNYADVACLIDSLGVPPTDIIGGHIWDPYTEKYANWERFRQPLQGSQFPHYTWSGRVLIGSGTPNHTYDPQPSGIWRPTDKYHYWQDEPEGNILCVGQYTGDLAGVQELVQLYRTDAIPADQILTCTIHTPQNFYSGFMGDFQQNLIEPLLQMQANGDIKLVDFVDLVEIWETEFGGRAHLYDAPTRATPSQFDVRVGSDSVFVQLSLPSTPRYQGQRAPVVVHVAGGWDGLGVTEKKHNLVDQGFIELDFNFPGSGLPGQMSGGVFDDRGEKCIRALRDVTQFALGKTPDIYGYYLHEMTGDVQPAYDNVGLCGWSNGGNATITAAGAFGEDLQGLAWIVNWESPVGDGMPNVDAGVRENLNPAYDPDTGEFDMSLLAYAAEFAAPDGAVGGLYFDINQNGELDGGVDYLASYHSFLGLDYYSNRIRQAAEELGVSLADRIATVQETQEFWHWRNGENWIESSVQANPDLMFIVEAGDRDHVQGAIDHPHVLIQYEGYRNAGARFVRLNPDRSYVEAVLGMAMPDAVDNDAFAPFDHLTIRTAVQPRDIVAFPSGFSVAAALCEVADRTKENNLAPQLGDDATGVETTGIAPMTMSLAQNYPNPFNGRTFIQFSVGQGAEAAMTLYDVLGKVVRRWRIQGSAEQSIVWDGRDSQGREAPSGVYIYRLETSRGESMVRKMLMTK